MEPPITLWTGDALVLPLGFRDGIDGLIKNVEDGAFILSSVPLNVQAPWFKIAERGRHGPYFT